MSLCLHRRGEPYLCLTPVPFFSLPSRSHHRLLFSLPFSRNSFPFLNSRNRVLAHSQPRVRRREEGGERGETAGGWIEERSMANTSRWVNDTGAFNWQVVETTTKLKCNVRHSSRSFVEYLYAFPRFPDEFRQSEFWWKSEVANDQRLLFRID